MSQKYIVTLQNEPVTDFEVVDGRAKFDYEADGEPFEFLTADEAYDAAELIGGDVDVMSMASWEGRKEKEQFESQCEFCERNYADSMCSDGSSSEVGNG